MKDRTEIAERLAACGYIADGELATAVSLMQLLKRPLLLEGEAAAPLLPRIQVLAPLPLQALPMRPRL